MVFSLIILLLMIVFLILYFILNKKIKMPTRVTELLINNYNKKVKKILKFTKKNEIDFDASKYYSKLIDAQLTFNNLKININKLKNIEKNNKLINEMLNSKTKKEFLSFAKELSEDCEFYQFKDELKIKNEEEKILYIFGLKKTKLDFEMQKYFGSQYFFFHDDKYFFLYNLMAYIIDEKNIFESKIIPYKLIIKEDNDKNKEKSDVFELIIQELNIDIKIQVPQNDVKKYLKKTIKQNEKTL